ncbi:putative flippase GtrA [Mycolicibacterium iranicum]|uniref:Putative flippase GtrA n=1 Tax=Mycolicibacterium iranicum TaxID=912594 RepID=A0A839Q5V4_MYCIR|nr:GtrA family protein [Mycolicibacterium iranicum]MBB2988582.1 putative flippase GtrA [Mycolicibacterium iranicum]
MLVLAPETFHRWCHRVTARLPWGLDRLVAPTLLGFCLINSFTFGVDLVLLVSLRGGLGVPYPVAVTVAYACAFALSYALNRYFNFRSHAPAGPQLAIYVVVVVVNYLAFILALSTLLTTFGVDYRIARLMAGACEAVYMYCALRWVVFRKA